MAVEVGEGEEEREEEVCGAARNNNTKLLSSSRTRHRQHGRGSRQGRGGARVLPRAAAAAARAQGRCIKARRFGAATVSPPSKRSQTADIAFVQTLNPAASSRSTCRRRKEPPEPDLFSVVAVDDDGRTVRLNSQDDAFAEELNDSEVGAGLGSP